VALLISSLLVLLMAAPALANHVSSPTGSVTQDSSGTLVRGKNAGVMVSGTVTCDQDGLVYVHGQLSQPTKRGTTTGSFGTGWMTCMARATTTWVANATTSKGGFSRGTATLTVNAQLYVEEEGAPCAGDDYYCYEAGGVYYHYADGFINSGGGPLTIN